jgi:hypothetical protein
MKVLINLSSECVILLCLEKKVHFVYIRMFSWANTPRCMYEFRTDSSQRLLHFPRPLWKPNRIHKSHPLDPTWSGRNPVHTRTPCFFKIHFSIILTSTLSSFRCSSCFLTKGLKWRIMWISQQSGEEWRHRPLTASTAVVPRVAWKGLVIFNAAGSEMPLAPLHLLAH